MRHEATKNFMPHWSSLIQLGLKIVAINCFYYTLFHLIKNRPYQFKSMVACLSLVMITFYFKSAAFFLSYFRLCGFDPPRSGPPFGVCLAGDPHDWTCLALHGASREAPVCSELAPGQVSGLAAAWRNHTLYNPQFIPKALLFSTPWSFQELYQVCLLYKWVNSGDGGQLSSQKSTNNFLLDISPGQLYYFWDMSVSACVCFNHVWYFHG